jgi:hypothetical protein
MENAIRELKSGYISIDKIDDIVMEVLRRHRANKHKHEAQPVIKLGYDYTN